MATARTAFRTFAKSNPDNHGLKWSGRCAALVDNLVGASTHYNTAWDARKHTSRASNQAKRAPVGAVHYWSTPRKKTGEIGTGHVGIQVDVAGNIAMASGKLSKKCYNHGLGTNTKAQYGNYLGAVYWGWSYRYGSNDPWSVKDFGHLRASLQPKPKPKRKPIIDPIPGGTLSIASSSAGKVLPAAGPAVTNPLDRDVAMVRRVADYLNNRHVGKSTAASKTGVRGPRYWRELQTAGRQDGLYGPGFLVNGIPGPRSRFLEKHYAAVTRAAQKR